MLPHAMTRTAAPFATPDARWEAFTARDAAADGRFVAAVTSTGIYCRPTCQARKPKRENVRFYETSAEAEAAGFRACKRCRPDEPVPRYADLVAVARRLAAGASPHRSLCPVPLFHRTRPYRSPSRRLCL